MTPDREAAVGRLPARLSSIDVARAVAIMMMLQGHFVALSLSPAYRDLGDPAFRLHAQLRGLTAPLFLTVSGLVFAYFVRGGEGVGLANPRLRRGLRRGLLLLLAGYALRLDVSALFDPGHDLLGRLSGTHVLHVVGVGLWVLSLAYLGGSRLPKGVLGGALAALGLGIFASTELVQRLDLQGLPSALASYVAPQHSHHFALFPWLGYMCLGGACGALLPRDPEARPRLAWSFALLTVAGLLEWRATAWVFRAYRACDGHALCAGLPASHNYLHSLAAVLALLALLVAAEPWLRRYAPAWLIATGRHTLLVFVVHAVVLYGAVTGLGVAPFVRLALTPPQAAIGALGFVVLHVLFVQLWIRRFARPPFTRSAPRARAA